MRIDRRAQMTALAAALTLTVAFQPPLRAADTAAGLPPAKRLAAMRQFTHVLGLEVRSPQNEFVGRIDDLLLDMGTGEIVCTVIKPAGAVEGLLVAVPPQCFLPTEESPAQLSAGKATVASAPRVLKGVTDDAVLGNVLDEAYAHFHQQRTWTGSARGIVWAGNVVGLPTRNAGGDDLGNLIDLMVDLPTARLVFGVLSLDGSERTRYAAPPAAIAVDAANQKLFLNASKEQITAVAQKGDRLFKEMADPVWAAATYGRYSAPVIETRAPQAGLSSPANLPDDEIKKRIITAMIRDDRGGAYRQLKLQSVNGHVTLQGRTRTSRQKDEMGKLAEGVVGAGNVDNQIEVVSK